MFFRNFRRNFVLIGLVAVVAVTSRAAEIFPDAGKYSADLLELAAPAEMREIGLRMHRALAADPTWLKSYLEENHLKPGEALPYHEKFGITQEEYNRFLASVGKLTLQKVKDVTVRVSKAEDKVTITLEGIDLPMRVFEFSPDGEAMTCTLGSTTDHVDIDQENADAPTGKWHGTQWEVRKGDPESGNEDDFVVLQFSLGIDPMKRNLINVRIRSQTRGRASDVSNLVRWPASELHRGR